jgi:hypothetical protein
MTVEQRLAETLRKLTPTQQERVLDFAESLRSPAPQQPEPRPVGLAAGDFTVPEDFDDPLPEDELRLFEQ